MICGQCKQEIGECTEELRDDVGSDAKMERVRDHLLPFLLL
jgi:hypothetical protein